MEFLEKYGRGIFFIVAVNVYFIGNFYFLSASPLADRYLQSFFADAMFISLLVSVLGGKLVIEAMFIGHIPLLVAYVSIYGILASGYMWWIVIEYYCCMTPIERFSGFSDGQQIVFVPLLAVGLIHLVIWKLNKLESVEKLVIGDVRKTEIKGVG